MISNSSILRLLAIPMLASVVFLVAVRAFETDQYNLPPVPLADIGPEIDARIAAVLAETVRHVNEEIVRESACLRFPIRSECRKLAETRERLTYLRSPAAVAKTLSDLLAGDRLMTTRFGKWMADHKFASQPDRYRPGFGESIYWLNPPNHLTLSPTVKVYGHEFGIDKLEHFFQQGYQYYAIRSQSLAAGKSNDDATREAIEWGRRTERTYYGLLTSGVYSNADLVANFAGLRFYEGLTRPVRLGDETLPALTQLQNGYWELNVSPSSPILQPYVSDHLNEAYNPSAFRLTLVAAVRRAIRQHACEDWKTAFPTLTRESLTRYAAELQLWHGENYGFTKRSRMARISDECFADPGNLRSGR